MLSMFLDIFVKCFSTSLTSCKVEENGKKRRRRVKWYV